MAGPAATGLDPTGRRRSADVVVHGATAGGAVAAVAAARAGASVVLLEPGRHVGGMLSGGLSRTDVERQENLIGGVAAEVFERIGAAYGLARTWRFEPHVAEAVLRDLLGEAAVELVTEAELSDARMAGRRIERVTLEDGTTIAGAVWIDASYEGDLLAAAGASWELGRDSRERHGESLAGRREILPSPHQARAAVAARGEGGAFLPRVVSYDAIGELGVGDGKVQAACYRICLSRADDRRPLVAPPGYDRSLYVLVERYLGALVQAGARLEMHDVIGLSELPGDKADVNSHGPFSTNLPGAIGAYAGASPEERRAIRAEHEAWGRGLLHFLSTDAAVPGEIQAILEPWGYPADEFMDTEGWPHQLYVREARRLAGEHVLTQADLLGGVVPGDTVAMAGYNIDVREVQWVACPISRFPDIHDEVLVEGYLSVPVPPYGIPYRSLLPRRDEVENLLVSTCISASSVAFGSVRMEPQYLVLGHAAGTAAALAARSGTRVHDVDVARLREELRRAGQVLSA